MTGTTYRALPGHFKAAILRGLFHAFTDPVLHMIFIFIIVAVAFYFLGADSDANAG